jgi:hypothetical protein
MTETKALKRTAAVVFTLILLIGGLFFVFGCSGSNPAGAAPTATHGQEQIPTKTATIASLPATFTSTPIATITSTATPLSTATNTLTSTIEGTNTPTDTPTEPVFTGLLDNCDSGGSQNMFPPPAGPGFWYSFDDQPLGGISYVVPVSDAWASSHGMASVPFYMQAPGYDGTGYAARMTGYTSVTGYAYGFIGMGTSLIPSNGPVDLWTENTSMTFWEKGDGKTYVMLLVSASPLFTQGKYDNHYKFSFISTTNWSQVYVPYTALTQSSGWGSMVSQKNAIKAVSDIRWMTYAQPLSSVDLWVDQISFQ